jgi:Chaperone for flagella basal body P-ring formation
MQRLGRKHFGILVATIVWAGTPGSGLGQQPSAATRPVDAGEKRSLTKTTTKTAACAEVAERINGVLRAREPGTTESPSLPREISFGQLRASDLDCGAVPSVVPGIPLELRKIFYDRALHSWEFLLRCVRTSDCVPFLVRWPQPADQSPPRDPVALPRVSAPVSRIAPRTAPAIGPRVAERFLLHPGETVTLVWDRDGIRVVLPVVCLDRGNVGDSIRVRIKSGDRVLRAEIVNESLLRASL